MPPHLARTRRGVSAAAQLSSAPSPPSPLALAPLAPQGQPSSLLSRTPAPAALCSPARLSAPT